MRREHVLLALCGWIPTGFARAQPSLEYALVRSEEEETLEADLRTDGETAEGDESAELRALRLAEFEMFSAEESRIEASPTMPRQLRLTVPSGLTSDAPSVRSHVGASGTVPRLQWLERITLPDLPVRWDERVIRYLEFFRDDPRGQQLIRSWMRRLDRFGPTIRRTLREQRLPEDLIYLAMIESGFDPRARSDVGAVGLWQFVARTGLEYGLAQDHWVDMRMDPEQSTIAGARYLAQLRERFGTWELAFAAYNMGYGALLRSIRKYDTNDYWELSHLEAAMPFETTLYVAKVMACAVVGRNPELFGLSDLVREATTAFDVVEVPGGTGLASIARAAGTTSDEIHRLNPAFKRERVPPSNERVAVRIPAGREATFARAWARMRPAEPMHVPYVVRFGEELGDIARRHRVSESDLLDLNELENSADVRPGVALMVPSVTPTREEARREPTVVAIPSGVFEYPDRRRIFYRVVRRDALAEIARFFSVTVDEIRQWNAIEPRADLQSGMFLQLFVRQDFDTSRALVLGDDEVRTMVIGSEEFYQWHVAQEGRVRLRYRVRSGDTLSAIASRFGLSTGSMARINQIARSTTLREGQELIVYCTPDRVPSGMREQLATD